MKEKCGVIYILTNPSFPEYIKIGYADNVEERVKQLNNSEAVPFSFHIYATFDVTERLTDIKSKSRCRFRGHKAEKTKSEFENLLKKPKNFLSRTESLQQNR